MILVICPNLDALRLWMLRLDARLVTPHMQERWLAREKQARIEKLNVTMSMVTLGHKFHAKGGLA